MQWWQLTDRQNARQTETVECILHNELISVVLYYQSCAYFYFMVSHIRLHYTNMYKKNLDKLTYSRRTYKHLSIAYVYTITFVDFRA